MWAAVGGHDDSQPLVVPHTGVNGVHPIWRNLDDDQIRAVADTGGCIGVILHGMFLGAQPTAEAVADHVEHIADVGGEDLPAIGTDLDGMVVPPRDLRGYAQFPRLVAALMRRSWSPESIHKVLGGNALKTIEKIRG